MLSRHGRAALGYVRLLGWPVFPVWPRDKNPRTSGGHHDATLDEWQVTSWWRRWPDANVAVRVDDLLVVVDIDPRNGGDVNWELIAPDEGVDSVVAYTGGGGRHLVFRHDGMPWKRLLRPGVEIKAKGYIVVAPSVHASGQRYRWDLDDHPVEKELTEPPDWLKVAGMIDPYLPRERRPAAQTTLGRAFRGARMVRREIDEWRLAVDCPWEREHTTRGRTDTVVLGLGDMGWFHCSHSHCEGRTARMVLAELPPWAMLEAV